VSEQKKADYYETLQVVPDAEPEVVAAAYRALAKKYHPDRSDAPDAMAKMARLNVAFQALRSNKGGRLTEADSGLRDIRTTFTHEHANPSSTLEEALAIVGRKVAAARQQLVEEVTSDGFARDVAMGLVTQAFKEMCGGRGGVTSRGGQSAARVDPKASYDDALRIVSQRATALRDEFAEELVHGGLQKTVATELVDIAFERIRRRTESKGSQRLSSERVDLSSSLDKGVSVVSRKLRVARQLLVEELTRDGVPQRTAEQLVQSAAEQLDWSVSR
jgi:hypothetical protein